MQCNKFNRNLTLILLVLYAMLFSCGCALVKEAMSSYQACSLDPECVQQINDLPQQNSWYGILIGLASVLATGYGIKKYRVTKNKRGL